MAPEGLPETHVVAFKPRDDFSHKSQSFATAEDVAHVTPEWDKVMKDLLLTCFVLLNCFMFETGSLVALTDLNSGDLELPVPLVSTS